MEPDNPYNLIIKLYYEFRLEGKKGELNQIRLSDRTRVSPHTGQADIQIYADYLIMPSKVGERATGAGFISFYSA